MEGNLIRLSREEIQMAGDFGLTLQEYARGKRELMRQLAEYEAWLQTPAGVAYMAKRDEAHQRRLVKQREYSRAYRARKKAQREAANAP
jgi:hypothetical protein